MNNETKELLKECNQGCKMALNSMDQIQKYAADDSLKSLLEEYRGKFEQTEDRSSRMLEAMDVHEMKPKMMASAFSWISTEMKMMMEQDSHQIAKVMMDGCNMGIQSVAEYINKYTQASPESIELAHELLKNEEDFMDELKKYL